MKKNLKRYMPRNYNFRGINKINQLWDELIIKMKLIFSQLFLFVEDFSI